MRAGSPLFLLALALAVVSCAEIAEDYRTKDLLPEEIEAALRSDDPTSRAEAAEQIEDLPPERRIQVLDLLSRDPEPRFRLLAVSLLAKQEGNEAAIDRMAEILAMDGDQDVRTVTLDGLAATGSGRALEAIVEALEGDPSLIVRRQAASVLDRLTGQDLGSAFVTSLDEAEMSADEAAMEYSDWLEEHGGALRWDAGKARFVEAGEVDQ